MSRALPAALATAAAALALSGCIGGGAPKGNARQGGGIRIAFGARPDSLVVTVFAGRPPQYPDPPD